MPAVSPGLYIALSGTTVSACSSTVRVGGATAPLTQRVSSLLLGRPLSSVTVELTVYVPPIDVVNVHGTGSAPEVTSQFCGSTGVSTHEPFSYFDSVRLAVTRNVRPAGVSGMEGCAEDCENAAFRASKAKQIMLRDMKLETHCRELGRGFRSR